jgi:ubiquinone/menaquinone biosynthesis C-methylase UbiE
MSFYRDHVFPHAMNVVMDNRQMRENRARVCSQLRGEVVEIGFGTGLNLPHLPATVTHLHAVDPSLVGARIAARRVDASGVPVTLAGLDGQALAFRADSFDAALSTWTLCSIPDAVAALRELRRVLRPTGRLHFIEHGRAPDERVRRWQARLNPVQRRVGAGCTLDRDVPALLEAAGFVVDRLEFSYSMGQPKVFGATYEGVAVPA